MSWRLRGGAEHVGPWTSPQVARVCPEYVVFSTHVDVDIVQTIPSASASPPATQTSALTPAL